MKRITQEEIDEMIEINRKRVEQIELEERMHKMGHTDFQAGDKK